jgi:hypothetical protein
MRLSREELQRLIDDYHTELRLLTYRSKQVADTIQELEKQERIANKKTGSSVRRAAKKVATKSARKTAKKAAKKTARKATKKTAKKAVKKTAKKATKKTAKKAAKKTAKKAAKRGRPAKKTAKKAAKKATKKTAKKATKKAAKRGRPAKKAAAKKTTKKAAKRGRPAKKAAPRKAAAKKSSGGYRLNVWDEIVLKKLGSKSEGVFADFFKAAKKTSAGRKMTDKALYARINQSLHKLANKRGAIKKVKHEGRGFGYTLA